ncbi:MAG: DoxX family protein [Deltaproteobacteria bacterium]
MNVLLWVCQAALAFLYLAGGYFKAFKFDELASQYTALSHGGWRALGVLEMLGAVLLILPAATRWVPVLTLVAAAVLALESLALAAVFARHSLKLTAENPLVWNLVMGLLAAFVAYGRYTLSPLT